MKNKTIAIDFDGVIHQCSHGWQDGSAYDSPVSNAINKINDLVKNGYSVFIFSTRSASQVMEWGMKYSNPFLYVNTMYSSSTVSALLDSSVTNMIEEYSNKNQFQFKIEKIRFWKKFWNKTGVIGVTGRKLPAHIYIDDRAFKFTGDWKIIDTVVDNFRTYQETFRPLSEIVQHKMFIYDQLGASNMIHRQYIDDLIDEILRDGINQSTWTGIIRCMDILGFDTRIQNKIVF